MRQRRGGAGLATNAPASGQLQPCLRDDPRQHRFTLRFEREGYSPEFFAARKLQRIAMLSYHKYPGQDWPVEEFAAWSARLASGEELTRKLAERGPLLANHLWAREVPKLSEGGHPTSILSSCNSGAVSAPTALTNPHLLLHLFERHPFGFRIERQHHEELHHHHQREEREGSRPRGSR